MSALALFVAARMAGTAVGRRGWAGNQPPTVNAGSDQSVSTGATVNLSASGNDPDGSIASYAWTQISGTSISFSNAAIANPSFTAPGSATTIVVRCTVTDNLGATAFDDVQITVSASSGTNSPYSPTFTQATGGSLQVTLNWRLPDTTVDGLPLTGGDALTSLEIYYATTQANATVAAGTLVTVSNPADVSRVIGSLSASTQYWFVIRAISAYGPSDVSNAIPATTS